MKVAIIYHYLPHYRAAIFTELIKSAMHHYVIYADTESTVSTIPAWCPDDPERFRVAPCVRLKGDIIFQSNVVAPALSNEFDAIIYLGSMYFVSTWFSALLARLRGKRVIFWMHGWTHIDRPVAKEVRRLFYRIATSLLLYGRTAKAVGVTQGFSPKSIHVIYNSLDYTSQRQIRESIGEGRKREVRQALFPQNEWPVVICSARLTAECKFDLLFLAQAELSKRGHMINVLLIGDGPERASLEARAVGQSVRFYGACYDEVALAELTMASTVTVSPGKIGLTAMQTLAYGVPAITHDAWDHQMPEYEAIVPGITGDLFRYDDVQSLAECILRWTGSRVVPAKVRDACIAVIESRYNPVSQRIAIDAAVNGLPAVDEWS